MIEKFPGKCCILLASLVSSIEMQDKKLWEMFASFKIIADLVGAFSLVVRWFQVCAL